MEGAAQDLCHGALVEQAYGGVRGVTAERGGRARDVGGNGRQVRPPRGGDPGYGGEVHHEYPHGHDSRDEVLWHTS